MRLRESIGSRLSSPWVAWGLLTVLLGSASGCSGGSRDSGSAPSSPAPKTQPEKPRIALIMKSLANEFFKTMAEGAGKHQSEHSSEYELIVNGIKDERDLKRQVDLVEEMVAQRVNAIVIAPADSKALVSACKRAQEAGIAVVNIDNKLDSQVLADQGVKVPFVGPDNRGVRRWWETTWPPSSSLETRSPCSRGSRRPSTVSSGSLVSRMP